MRTQGAQTQHVMSGCCWSLPVGWDVIEGCWAVSKPMGGTPAASCRVVRTGPAVTCMLFVPKVEFSDTFRHVRPSRSWSFAQPKVGLCVCVQWVPKRPQMRAVCVQASLYHYINIQSCHFMQQFISPAILGMVQTVAVPQSQLRCCAVGAVRTICELMGGTPAASCQEGQTAPAVVCMLFIPRLEFSATFWHV